MEEERFARLNHRDSETSLDPTHFRMYSSGCGPLAHAGSGRAVVG